MINVRNESFWNGISSRNEELADRGFSLWAPPLDKSQIEDEILKEQASRGGRAFKADWLTVTIRRII
jgi:hypothetical protein